MAKGFDCARPLTASQAKMLAGEGMQFAARYLVPEALAWKRLIKEEAQAITNAGMQIVSVFETTANRAPGGAANGTPDGKKALAEAKIIGQPEGTTIYFAVDYDVKPSEYDIIERYLRAAAAEISGYEAGVYAEYAVIEEMAKRGAVKHFWQTYAWSGGKKSAHANIYQYKNGVTMEGVTLDLNESYGNEGWWQVPTPKPAPAPKPAEPSLDPVAVQKVINDLGSLYMASADKEVMKAAHHAANALRKAIGKEVN